jgi:phenylacetate-coenzyme A ligase PaaK-like adenylate-forming protein
MNGQVPNDRADAASCGGTTRRRLTAPLRNGISRLVVGVGLRHRLDLIEARRERHASVTDPEQMAIWQTNAFNQIWVSATQRIRFYAEWKRRHGLPDQVKEIGEITQFPILRRDDIDDSFKAIAEDLAPCDFVYSGGTTGNSRRFPRGSEDSLVTYANQYLGRSWAGISPGDSIVSIWGHEHLFGAGRMGQVKKVIRATKDWLIDTQRLNAYRLDEASVAAYFDAIRCRPGAVIIAYVSAIRKLLDFVERAGIDGCSARIRALIFCGEAVIARDLDRARKILGTVPLIEYGMMETGAMAYSCPQSSSLTFFWDAFHCHATSDRELVVTSLQPMRFPLINYGTEDRIEPLDGVPMLPFRCARILGRKSDIFQLKLSGGKVIEVYGELILDILDVIPEASSFVIRHKDRTLDVAVQLAAGQDLDAIRGRFLREIRRELSGLDESAITFSSLDRERQTMAGKRQVLVRGLSDDRLE